MQMVIGELKITGKRNRKGSSNYLLISLLALFLMGLNFGCQTKTETQEGISATIVGTAKIEGKEDNSGILVSLERGIVKTQSAQQGNIEYQSVASTTTEKSGSYTLFVKEVGVYRLRISAEGYVNIFVPNIVISGSGVYQVSPVVFNSSLTQGAFGGGTTSEAGGVTTPGGGTTLSELESKGVIIGYVFLPGATQTADMSGTTVELRKAEFKNGDVVYSPVATRTTQKDGKFLFENVPFGTYSLRITREGFSEHIIPNIVLASKIYDVGKITLSFVPETKVVLTEGGVLDFNVSPDGKVVAWRDTSGTLFSALPSLDSKETLGGPILKYYFVNGSTLVFMTPDRTLYAKQFGGTPETVGTNVEKYVVVGDNAFAFITSDRKLYVKKLGGSLTQIDSEVIDISLFSSLYKFFIYVKADGNYIANTDGAKRKLGPGVSPISIHKGKIIAMYSPSPSTTYILPYDLSADPKVVDTGIGLFGFFDLGIVYRKSSALWFYSYQNETTSKVKDLDYYYYYYYPGYITSVGNELYFAELTRIYYFDGSTHIVAEGVRGYSTFQNIALFYLKPFPNNATIAIMKFSYQGKSTQVIGQVDALVSGISVSPDGKYVYVYGGDMNNLFSIKEDGSGVANLLGKISEKYGDISCGFPEFVRDVQGAYIGKIRVYCSDSSTYRYYIIFLNPDGTDIFAIDNVSYQIYSGGSKIVWEKDGYLYISDLREGASPTIADLNVLGSFRVLPSAGKILYQKGEQAPWSSSWWSSYSLLFTSLDGSTKGVIDTGVSGDYFTTPDESYVIYTKWVFEVQGSSLSVKRVLKSAKLK